MTNANLSSWIDRSAFDPDGEEVGVIDDIYVDDATRQPEWLAIKTGRGGKGVSFVPLAGSGPRGDDVAIAHRKGVVDVAPGADPDGTLTLDEDFDMVRLPSKDVPIVVKQQKSDGPH